MKSILMNSIVPHKFYIIKKVEVKKNVNFLNKGIKMLVLKIEDQKLKKYLNTRLKIHLSQKK